MSHQNTLAASFTLSGKGLHTGLPLRLTFHPAPADTGYRIRRIDLEGQPVVEALARNVIDTSRGTVVGKGDVRISTIEHAMSALYAMGVDNCLMDVDGPEFPILDGSARYFVQEIQRVGLVAQDAPRKYFAPTEKFSLSIPELSSRLVITPADDYQLEVEISFESDFLRPQYAALTAMSDYAADIAAARTFVFVRDIEPLLQMGLIKGGDLDNAIVIYEHEVAQERLDKMADSLGVPHHDATQLGYINARPLTWPNEPARHKLLDVIGDFALTGYRIRGHVEVLRPGHTANNSYARDIAIAAEYMNNKR